MNALDEQIRGLVHDRVAEAPVPLSADEILLRADHVPVAADAHRRRWVWPALVAAAAAVVALVLVVDRPGHHSKSVASTSAITDDQLLLPVLPDGWVPVDVREGLSSGSDGFGTATAIFERAQPSARLQVWGFVGPNRSSTLAFETENAFELADGRRGSYTTACGGTCFDLVGDGYYVYVAVVHVMLTPTEVEELASQLSVDATGMPSIDGASGFVLDRSGRVDVPGLSTLSLRFGPATRGTGVVLLTITAGPGVPEAGLVAGLGAERREWHGEGYWVGDAGAVWSHGGALYQLIAFPLGSTDSAGSDAFALATAMAPATWHDVAVLAAQIGSTALVDSVDVVDIAGHDLGVEYRHISDRQYVCLSDGADPVCRIVSIDGAASFLLDGHWYIVQYYESELPTHVEEAEVIGDSHWRVAAIADDVDTVQIPASQIPASQSPPLILTRPNF